MDILDALRLAPSADLYRLYLTIGRMINDPKRILEVPRHLHIGMTVGNVADDLTQTVRQGRILELRQTQAVVQDTTSGRHWMPYAAVLAEPTTAEQQPPHASQLPPPPAQQADFLVGDTVSFTDKHLPATRTKVTGASPSHYCARSSNVAPTAYRRSPDGFR